MKDEIAESTTNGATNGIMGVVARFGMFAFFALLIAFTAWRTFDVGLIIWDGDRVKASTMIIVADFALLSWLLIALFNSKSVFQKAVSILGVVAALITIAFLSGADFAFSAKIISVESARWFTVGVFVFAVILHISGAAIYEFISPEQITMFLSDIQRQRHLEKERKFTADMQDAEFTVSMAQKRAEFSALKQTQTKMVELQGQLQREALDYFEKTMDAHRAALAQKTGDRIFKRALESLDLPGATDVIDALPAPAELFRENKRHSNHNDLTVNSSAYIHSVNDLDALLSSVGMTRAEARQQTSGYSAGMVYSYLRDKLPEGMTRLEFDKLFAELHATEAQAPATKTTVKPSAPSLSNDGGGPKESPKSQ